MREGNEGGGGGRERERMTNDSVRGRKKIEMEDGETNEGRAEGERENKKK